MTNPAPQPYDPNKPRVWELVIEDMRGRNTAGMLKYHTPLQPFNGRNPLQDAYEEALDLSVYLRQQLYETTELIALVHDMARLIEYFAVDLQMDAPVHNDPKNSMERYYEMFPNGPQP